MVNPIAFKNSLVAKLMLAFMLVAVPPMLIASTVATNLVNGTVNRNMERWLNDASNYLMFVIEETAGQISAAQVLLNDRFTGPAVRLAESELDCLPDLDVDYLQVRNSAGEIIYSNSPPVEIFDTPLFAGSHFRWAVSAEGRQELAIVSSRRFRAWDGSERRVDFLSWFEIELAESEAHEPFEFRILLPEGDGFKQVYASAGSPPHDFPQEALLALRRDAKDYFIPDADWTDDTPHVHFMLKPIRDDQGKLLAVYANSIHQVFTEADGVSSRTLFWTFFLLGSLLSLGCGYLLAKRLVRPIKQLNAGVKSIAAEDFGCQVAVSGKDEVAELGEGFNLMSSQLAVMKRTHQQSARQERTRMLGEIALGFAHEIRNPLVVIKTSAEVVQGKISGQVKEARLLGFVMEEVGRIDSLITEFLSFAKPTPLKLEYFSLRRLVDEVLAISEAEFKRRGISVQLADEAKDSSLLAELNQIRQVLLNLILNSMDAMPEGGELKLKIYDSGPELCLEIGDNGVGIPEDLLPTVHLPFISTKKNGLGLGLSKVYAAIEEHGGSVSCRSKQGEGTVFTVCLPK